jgi:hypothetical protein
MLGCETCSWWPICASHANLIFGLELAKAWQAVVSKYQPKMMLFAVMAPYQFVPNHFMSSIWVQ